MADDKQITLKILAQNAARDAFQQVRDDAKAAGQGVQDSFGDGMKSTFSQFEALAKQAFENPGEAAKNFAEGIKGGLLESLTGATGAMIAGGAAAVALAAGLFELANKASEVGENLHDMELKTGIGVPALSNLKGAAELAGGTLDQVSNAIFKLEANIGSDSAKTAGGLAQIGLSLEDIKSLSPDQQFLAIADAIKRTEDPATRAAAAVAIFGKQGRDLLPLMLEPLDDLIQKSRDLGLTWTDEEATAAKEFETATRALKLELTATGTSIGRDLTPAMTDLVAALGFVGEKTSLVIQWLTPLGLAWKETAAELALFNAAAAVYNGTVGAVPTVTGPASTSVKDWTKAVQDRAAVPLALGLGEEKTATRELDAQIQAHEAEVKKAQAEEIKWQALLHEFATVGATVQDTINGMDGSVVEGTKYYLDHGVAVDKIAKLYGITTEQVKAVQTQLAFTNQVGQDTNKTFKDAAPIIGLMNDRFGDSHAALTGLANDGQTLTATMIGNDSAVFRFANQEAYAAEQSAGLRSALAEVNAESKSLGDVLEGTLKGSLGDVNNLLSAALSGGNVGQAAKSLATNLGSSLLDAIPVVGPYISQFAGAITSALSNLFGGPSQTELDGRKIEASFEQGFGGFQGMMDQVGAAYAATGRSAQQAQADVKALLDAEKAGGPAVQAVIDQINKAFTDEKTNAANVATGVNAIVTAVKAVGASAPAALQGMITALETSTQLTADEKAALDGLVQSATPNFAALQQTAANYGISLAALGPKFQQANLDASAKTIFQDFTDLTNAGADVGGVLQGMSGAISQLVTDSIKFGTAIPLNMKPLIDNLEESGQLLDANGQQITDISGLTWEDTPLDKGTQAIVNAIHDLNTTLANLPGVAATAAAGIGSALTSAANNVPTIHVPYEFDQQGSGVPAFADEAFVRRPTLAIVGDAPGGEFVLKPSTVQRLIDRAATLGASAAPGIDLSGLEAGIAGLGDQLAGHVAAISRMMGAQPYLIRDAILASGGGR